MHQVTQLPKNWWARPRSRWGKEIRKTDKLKIKKIERFTQ